MKILFKIIGNILRKMKAANEEQTLWGCILITLQKKF